METNSRIAVFGSERPRKPQAGFSLLELLVALSLFVVIAGAIFGLVQKHIPVFTSQQNQANLNFALRNAIAQMQIDVANAGEGFYTGADVAAWPVGLTINNTSNGNSCSNGKKYGDTCFDVLNVVAVDRFTPPAHISNSIGATIDTSAAGLVIPLMPPTGFNPATYAAKFAVGDQVLFLEASQQRMTTCVVNQVSSDATTTRLGCGSTLSDGSNGKEEQCNKAKCPNDPLGITEGNTGKGTLDASQLTNLFTTGSGGDWVLRLAPITFSVSVDDPDNPKLIRTDLVDCPTGCVLAEQIIGFRVGASVMNAKTGNDASLYIYDRLNAARSYAWSDIRSVRITIIGRTDPTVVLKNFKNQFDYQPYKIQNVTVVVSPRNLGMLN